nr:MAG TPA: hypothetical protein [Caudoviricetes sp.]
MSNAYFSCKKVWWVQNKVILLQHQNPQASQRCSNRGSFYFCTL